MILFEYFDVCRHLKCDVILLLHAVPGPTWYLSDKNLTESNFDKPFIPFVFVGYEFACEVSAVGQLSDFQAEGHGFIPRAGWGVELWATFFRHTVDRDVRPLV